ncbi:TonB-dependent receptor [Luteimonas sp. RIT-PG2_3]
MGKTSKVHVSALALVAAVAVAAMPAMPASAQSQEQPQARAFDIARQDLAAALEAFGRQSGKEILYDFATASMLISPDVRCECSPADALARLLHGSGLRFRQVGADVYVVERDAVQEGEDDRRSSVDEMGVVTTERVSVTGSRIRRADVESNHPLAVIDKRQIDSLSTTHVVDVLNRQPQLSLGGDLQVSTVSAGFKNSGVSTANLRGLGDNRTLVLINGRRQVAGTSGTSAVDLNTVSKTSLERVDIVTGGSSAVYGADAIAGVVNLITRQGFDGFLGEAQVGSTSHGGGATRSLAMTLGRSFADDRGNVMLSLSHDRERPVYWAQRKWGWEPGGKRGTLSYVANPLRTPGDTSEPRFVSMYGISGITYREYGHPVLTTPLAGMPAYSLSFDDAGQLIPYDVGTRLTDGSGRLQNVALDCPDCYLGNQLGTARNGLERTGAELQLTFSFLRDGQGVLRELEGFLEAKRYGIDSSSQFGFANYAGAGPSSVRAGGYALRIDNPFVSDALVALMQSNGIDHVDVTRINNDLAQDVDAMRAAYAAGQPFRSPGALLDLSSEFRMQRAVAGVRGVFVNDWNFEVYGNYGRTRSRFSNSDFMDSLFRQQVDAVRDPLSGGIVCRSTLVDPGNGCVPINILQVGTTSFEALAYSYRRPLQRDVITQANAVATVDGTLFSWDSPGSGAELPVAFAAGLEYRRESSQALPDADGMSGDLFHLGPKVATIGHYSSWEAFAELNLPLLRDVRFARSLEVTASYRFQDYTTTGTDGSYGLSASWMPVDDIKFRGAYARAVRAPNVSELFSGTNVSNQSIADPCDVSRVATGPAPGNRQANCGRLLGTAAADFVQTPSGKFVVLQGNPNLAAETADTVTAGIVLAPRWIPGLVLTGDYYANEIDGVITSLSAPQIAENCVDSPNLDNDFCRSITRDVSGNLDVVVAQVFNLARYRARGWDFGASYRFDLPANLGRLALQAHATHLRELVYDPVPLNPALRTRLDRIAPNPTWRSNVNARYERGNVNVDWNVRYLGGVIRNWNDVVGDYSMAEAHPDSGSFIQHDVRVGLRFDGYQVYAGVDNLFDAHAPMTPFTYTHPMYPRIGRNLYAGVRISF